AVALLQLQRLARPLLPEVGEGGVDLLVELARRVVAHVQQSGRLRRGRLGRAAEKGRRRQGGGPAGRQAEQAAAAGGGQDQSGLGCRGHGSRPLGRVGVRRRTGSGG